MHMPAQETALYRRIFWTLKCSVYLVLPYSCVTTIAQLLKGKHGEKCPFFLSFSGSFMYKFITQKKKVISKNTSPWTLY